MPSPGYRVSGKEVQVRDSGSRHHQLCGCCDLQLIQSHAAPSHGPPARVLSPLFFPAKSLLLPNSVAKRSTPKPRGPLYSPSEPCGPFPHFRTTWTSIYLLASEPRGSPIYFRAAWSTPYLLWSRVVSSSFRASWSPPHLLWSHVVSSFLPQNLVVLLSLWLPGLGLNPSAHLPLQPHF